MSIGTGGPGKDATGTSPPGTSASTRPSPRAPFTNLNLPQLSLRGGLARTRTDNWSSSFYYGEETLSQGNRVPYRVVVPQNALGLDTTGRLLDRLQLGFRLLHLASSPERAAQERTCRNCSFVRLWSESFWPSRDWLHRLHPVTRPALTPRARARGNPGNSRKWDYFRSCRNRSRKC